MSGRLTSAVVGALIASACMPVAGMAQKKSDSNLEKAAKEYSFEVRPTIGVVFPTSPDGQDVGWDIGGSLRATPPKWDVGLQVDFMLVDLGSSIFQATADIFWEFGNKTSAFHPYIIGGLGLYDGDFGLNGGLGLDFAVVNAPFGFFVESRYHAVFEDGPDLGFIPLNAGIRLRF